MVVVGELRAVWGLRAQILTRERVVGSRGPEKWEVGGNAGKVFEAGRLYVWGGGEGHKAWG